MGKVVLIDAGHGGTDAGAVGNGMYEKTLTLRIALLTEKYLLEDYKGATVVQTRRGDSTLSLQARTDAAKRARADALVSIHINSAVNAAANGYEDFRHTTQGVTTGSGKLQTMIHSRVTNAGVFPTNRGKKQANFHMVREALPIASTLLEFGFIVNKNDAAKLRDDKNLQKLAKATADGIAAYLGLAKASKPVMVVPKERHGVATMKVNGVKEYEEPSFDSKVMRTHKKGDVRNIYLVRDGWYLTFSGHWIPSNYGKNFDYKADNQAETAPKEPPTAKDMMAVRADGIPIGAFISYENMAAAAEKAAKAGAEKIEIERV